MMKRSIIILLTLLLPLSVQAQTEWTDSLRLTPGVRVSTLDGSDASDLRVDIRALSALRGNQQALWVIDGAVLTLSSPHSVQPFFQYGDAAYTALSMGSGNSWLNSNDIERIEVLRNTSATAAYGSLGAGGVILVKTKKPVDDASQVQWCSRIGLRASEVSSDSFTPAFMHNHYISVGSAGKRSWLRVSAFFSDEYGVVKGCGKDQFGATASMGSTKSDVVSFGGNLRFNSVSSLTQSGAAWYGAPSFALSVRDITPDPQGWMADYDNERKALRSIGDIYFNVKISPFLHWDNTVSADFQALSQYIWYGNGTAFGKAQNGAAAVISSSLLYIDGRSTLSFARFFGKVHQLKASLGAILGSNLDYYNTMTGTNFVSHDLRARGLNVMESRAVIRHYNQSLVHVGGQATLHYDYAGAVGADLSLRVEPYLTYDKGRNAGDFIYPSGEAFVDLKPLLFSLSTQLHELRLEAGYGIAGRRTLVPYDMLPLYTGSAYPQVEEDFKAYYKGFNRVRDAEFHIGISTSLFKDRALNLYAGYYDRNIQDALSIYKRDQDQASELSAATSGASLRGIEGKLEAVLLKVGDTKLTLRLNADYNWAKTTAVAQGDEYGMGLNQYDLRANTNQVGSSPASLYGWVLDENNTAVREGILGNTLPRFTAAGELAFRWDRLTTSITAHGAIGFHILNMNRMLASGQEYISSAFVEKGDYLRLSAANIAYDIPIQAKWIKGLGVSLAVTNLLTATSYSGWNPDVNAYGYTLLANGLDYGSFPLVRSFILGISAKF